jgi:hypothetical protein
VDVVGRGASCQLDLLLVVIVILGIVILGIVVLVMLLVGRHTKKL